MDKKVIALIVVVVIVVGAYAGYYAYATMVLQPEDLKVFKEELDAASNLTIDTGITDSQISTIESSNVLASIPQTTRDELANNLTSGSNTVKSTLETAKKDFTGNREIASRYDWILKSDVANNIRLAYDQKMIDLIDQMLANMDKQATDIKNGDTVAYANDLREFNKLASEYNSYVQKTKEYLQQIVNKLGG
jgi:hypothetical protein